MKNSSILTRMTLGLVLLMTVFGFAGANAQSKNYTTINDMQLGEEYTVPKNTYFKGSFTAPAEGEVKMLVRLITPGVFSDQECTVSVPTNFGGYESGFSVYKFNVKKDQTVYFDSNMSSAIGGDGVVMLLMPSYQAQDLEVNYTNLEQGNTVQFAVTENLRMEFNQQVTIGTGHNIAYKNAKTGADATVSARASLTKSSVGNSLVNIFIYEALRPLLESGDITPGERIDITVKGVKSLAGGVCKGADENGDMHFNFKCGSVPAVKLSESVPTEFLSYWKEGDPSGRITMTFDKELNIDLGTYGAIGYGNLESENEYYYERVPVSLSEDKKTLVLDLTGKQRTVLDMIPLASNTYETIGVQLSNVRDSYGNLVKSDSQGSTGSWGWGLPYKEIRRSQIVSEFTPANGESLQGVDNVTVWLSPLNEFTFTGFRISYLDGSEVKTVVVPKDKASVSNQDETSAEYTFAVPAEVKGKSDIEITLDGFVTTDGYDHSFDVVARYDTFVILYSDPANGSSLESLAEGRTITIEPNYLDKYPEMYIMYRVRDLNPEDETQAIVKTDAWMTYDAAKHSFSAVIPKAVKLMLGHNYDIEFTAWESEAKKNSGAESVGTASVRLIGSTLPFLYSDIELESISPEEGTELEAVKTEFTLAFTGMVNLSAATTYINGGQGVRVPFESITPIDPEDYDGAPFANKWTLTVSQEFMESLYSDLEFIVAPVDGEGKLVKGNTGEDANTRFVFVYPTKALYADVDVELSSSENYPFMEMITVSSADGISPDYNLADNAAYVSDASGNKVAEVKERRLAPEDAYPAGSELCPFVDLLLDKKLTESGTYTLFIPKGYFIIGDEKEIRSSIEKSVEFSIVASGADIVRDENHFTVYGVDGVRILDTDDANVLDTLPAGLYIVNGKKVLIRK